MGINQEQKKGKNKKDGTEEVKIDIEELGNDTKIEKEIFLYYFRRKR